MENPDVAELTEKHEKLLATAKYERCKAASTVNDELREAVDAMHNHSLSVHSQVLKRVKTHEVKVALAEGNFHAAVAALARLPVATQMKASMILLKDMLNADP